ncbi:MAG: DUF5714 domain-containing protein [Eubacteriales bacterium]|nr:DUF5714 domain-containing protein [Eubacteriales bacterium]
MECCQETTVRPEEHFTGCLICGGELVYSEDSRMRTCAVCGKKSLGNAVCEHGHYVCDACHEYGAFAGLIPVLRDSTEKDPLRLFDTVTALPGVHMHGPEHHVIVPLVLLTAYRNCGGKFNYDSAMREAQCRAKQVPGGTCGYWGVCGAAAGAGIYASVLLGSNPMHREAWPLPQKLVADILTELAEVGGPRCCKRTGRIAMEKAAEFTGCLSSVKMPVGEIQCKYVSENKECIRVRCPYYPGNRRNTNGI